MSNSMLLFVHSGSILCFRRPLPSGWIAPTSNRSAQAPPAQRSSSEPRPVPMSTASSSDRAPRRWEADAWEAGPICLHRGRDSCDLRVVLVRGFLPVPPLSYRVGHLNDPLLITEFPWLLRHFSRFFRICVNMAILAFVRCARKKQMAILASILSKHLILYFL